MSGPRALEGQSLAARSQFDGALGRKYQISKTGLFTFNLMTPLNSAGIRPNPVISTGLQFGF